MNAQARRGARTFRRRRRRRRAQFLFGAQFSARNPPTPSLSSRAHRSHAIVSLELAIPDPTPGAAEGATLRPKLLFVDLAGSERTKRAGTSGQSLREGIQINLSLLCLGDVVQALSKGQDFVPYNRSSLTKILQVSRRRRPRRPFVSHRRLRPHRRLRLRPRHSPAAPAPLPPAGLARRQLADRDARVRLARRHRCGRDAVDAARRPRGSYDHEQAEGVHAAAPTLTKEAKDARVREALQRECTAAKQELELVKEELDERGAEHCARGVRGRRRARVPHRHAAAARPDRGAAGGDCAPPRRGRRAARARGGGGARGGDGADERAAAHQGARTLPRRAPGL